MFKKIIGIDIDGVITDEGIEDNNIWLKTLRNYLKRNIKRKEDVYDFNEAFNISKEDLNDFLENNLENIYSNAIPYPTAIEVIKYLRDKDFIIYLITARNIKYNDLTMKWLNKYNIPYNELIHEKDKAPLAYEKNIELFIEDNESNAIKLIEYNIPVILVDKYHNRNIINKEKLYRVNNWLDIKRIIDIFFKI
jgi:uncharacterized protein